MSELNPKDNSRFYEVAHEFGLIVEGEAYLTRKERRDKVLMKEYKQKAKMDLFKKLTRHGAASHCHELNKANPQERWTVISAGNCYVPDYDELKAAKL